jgi:hypothetical protein
MNSSAIQRLVKASGVAIIYGSIFKFSHPSHSLPQSSYLNAQQQQKIRDLESFKLNLVFEANELIENLNHVLFQELRAIHEKYSFDASSSSSTDVIDQWVRKHTKHSLPNFSTEMTSDERIKSKLRVISPKDLQKLYKPNLPTAPLPSASISQSVDAVIEQFYRLEHEVNNRFSEQQLQVNDTIKSLRTRIFAEKEIGSFLAIFSALSQLLGCQAFLSFTNKIFQTSRTPPLIHPSRPFSTPVTLLLALPLAAMISFSDQADDSAIAASNRPGPRHLSSQSPHPNPAGAGPGIRVALPSPSVKHLPQNIYHFSFPPPIHKPCSDRNDPWRPWSVFVNILLPPIVEGYVFRKLLLDALLASTSPLKANFLVAVAVTACHVGMSSDASSIYEIKHSLSGAYDVNHPPEEVHRTLSIPLHPLIIQCAQYLTGSLFVSTVSHVTTLFLRYLSLHYHAEDVLFSPTHSRYYDHIIRLYSYLHSPVLSSAVVGIGKTADRYLDGTHAPVLRDLLIKNLEIINESTEAAPASAAPAPALRSLPPSELKAVTIPTEDLLDLEAMLSCQKINLVENRKPVMPPKFQQLQQKKIPTPPFSHRKESGYFYEHFLPNSKVGEKSLAFASRRLATESLAVDGKVDFLKAMLWPINSIPRGFYLRNPDPSQVRQFKRQVFYWDERATEEELLDLVHEVNAHVLEKILRSVDLYRATRGAWMCLELQGQEVLEKEVEQEMLERYLTDLDHFISVVQEREWHVYTAVYGLSPHRLKSLITRRGREHPELVELWRQWAEYLQSEELREKIHQNGNPFRVYRPRPAEEEEGDSTTGTDLGRP